MSRSGQTRSPKKSRSSPVFTTTVSSRCGTTCTSPARKRAAPTPPASATTRRPIRPVFACAPAPCSVLGFRAQRGELGLQAGQALRDLAHVRVGRELGRVPALRRDQVAQLLAVPLDRGLDLG